MTSHETAHTISLISPSKSSSSSNASNSDPTGAKFVLRVEWNETVRTRRDPFDIIKFSSLTPEILVKWIAPYVLCTVRAKKVNKRLKQRNLSDFIAISLINYGLLWFFCHCFVDGNSFLGYTCKRYMAPPKQNTWIPLSFELRSILARQTSGESSLQA